MSGRVPRVYNMYDKAVAEVSTPAILSFDQHSSTGGQPREGGDERMSHSFGNDIFIGQAFFGFSFALLTKQTVDERETFGTFAVHFEVAGREDVVGFDDTIACAGDVFGDLPPPRSQYENHIAKRATAYLRVAVQDPLKTFDRDLGEEVVDWGGERSAEDAL